MAGSVVGIFQKLPSASTVIIAGSYLAVPGLLSFFVFDHFVDPRPRWNFTTKTRVSVLGGYFVLGGLLAQLMGAAFDLLDFNG